MARDRPAKPAAARPWVIRRRTNCRGESKGSERCSYMGGLLMNAPPPDRAVRPLHPSEPVAAGRGAETSIGESARRGGFLPAEGPTIDGCASRLTPLDDDFLRPDLQQPVAGPFQLVGDRQAFRPALDRIQLNPALEGERDQGVIPLPLLFTVLAFGRPEDAYDLGLVQQQSQDRFRGIHGRQQAGPGLILQLLPALFLAALPLDRGPDPRKRTHLHRLRYDHPWHRVTPSFSGRAAWPTPPQDH